MVRWGSRFRELNRLGLCFKNTLTPIAALFIIIFVVIIVFAIVGGMLFGGRFRAVPGYMYPRLNFDDFAKSMLTLYVVLTGAGPPPTPPPPPTDPPCVTFRRVVVPLRGPGQSPVLPFACCVGSLRSVGRCSCWCRCRVRGAPSLVCRGCAECGGMCRVHVSGAQSLAYWGLCWLLPGSFDCFCCPHTSVHRPIHTRTPWGRAAQTAPGPFRRAIREPR